MTATVLYVEDNEGNRLLMQTLFERIDGLRLVCAGTGREAMAVAEAMAPSSTPSLLLLDICLPDCSGTDLLLCLRQIAGYAEIPAIAVTAEDLALEGSGFEELWRKPLNVPAVLRSIEARLGARAE